MFGRHLILADQQRLPDKASSADNPQPTPPLPSPILTKSLYYDNWKSDVFHRLLTVTFLQQPISSGHGTDTESYHISLHPLLLNTNQQLIKHCIFIDKQMEVNFLGLAQLLALLVEINLRLNNS